MDNNSGVKALTIGVGVTAVLLVLLAEGVYRVVERLKRVIDSYPMNYWDYSDYFGARHSVPV